MGTIEDIIAGTLAPTQTEFIKKILGALVGLGIGIGGGAAIAGILNLFKPALNEMAMKGQLSAEQVGIRMRQLLNKTDRIMDIGRFMLKRVKNFFSDNELAMKYADGADDVIDEIAGALAFVRKD